MRNEASETISYTFHQVNSCNMCGSSVDTHKKVGQRLSCSQGLSPKSKIGISISVMKCDVCGLVYANPQPIPNDYKDHDFADVWSAGYFEYDEKYFINEILQIKKLLNFEEGMKALDIGAGIGKAMRAFEAAGFEAWGIEPSYNACQTAFDKMSVAPDKLICQRIEDADFGENFFDFINFGAVLEHLYNPAQSLKLALKWLKPNGIIFAEVPNSAYFITKLLNTYNKVILSDYTCHISPMHAPFHHFEFRVKSFEKFCESNNCEIAHSQVHVCETPFVPKMIVPFLDSYMKRTNKGMQISAYLRKI